MKICGGLEKASESRRRNWSKLLSGTPDQIIGSMECFFYFRLASVVTQYSDRPNHAILHTNQNQTIPQATDCKHLEKQITLIIYICVLFRVDKSIF